jgi:hypothetical protein
MMCHIDCVILNVAYESHLTHYKMEEAKSLQLKRLRIEEQRIQLEKEAAENELALKKVNEDMQLRAKNFIDKHLSTDWKTLANLFIEKEDRIKALEAQLTKLCEESSRKSEELRRHEPVKRDRYGESYGYFGDI